MGFGKTAAVTGWQRKYRWTRTWPGETGIDGKPHEDYVGYDGDQNIGRIYQDLQTLKAGQWRWCAQWPRGLSPVMPHNGWLPTAGEAARRVEEYWDRIRERAG
jgi:hypothetical protein